MKKIELTKEEFLQKFADIVDSLYRPYTTNNMLANEEVEEFLKQYTIK